MLLIKPIFTEQSLLAAQTGRYSFAVVKNSRKPEIKRAVEEAFGVEVIKIMTAKIPAKSRRGGKRRLSVKSAEGKKAMVQLKAGQKIDIFEFGDEHSHA